MRIVTRESALWWAILALALATRVLNLYVIPLSDSEASVALSSLAVARGGTAAFANPLLGSLQSFLFLLTGSGEIAARLPAALAGTALVALPCTARAQLGRTRALLMALLLALSPSVWFVSRQSDGAMLAWLFALAIYLLPGRSMLFAACIGLLMACGRDAALPAITLLAGLSLRRDLPFRVGSNAPFQRTGWRVAALSFGLGATGMLFNPPGLGSAFNGIAAFFADLFRADGLSLARLVVGLVVYELPLLVIAATAIVVISRRGGADTHWLAWIVIGALAGLFVQPRSAASVLPLIIGACALAARSLAWLVQRAQADSDAGERPITLSLAGLAVVLLSFGFIASMQYSNQGLAGAILAFAVSALALAGVCLMSAVRVPVGVPVRGALLGVLICAAVYTFGTGFNLTQLRANEPGEPYVQTASAGDLRELQMRIELLGTRAFSDLHALPISVDDTAPPALRWMLRDQSRVQFGSAENTDSALLVPMGGQPRDQYGYIGDAFTVQQSASLRAVRCKNIGEKNDCSAYARWLLQRQTDSARPTQWILWVRSDTAALLSGRR